MTMRILLLFQLFCLFTFARSSGDFRDLIRWLQSDEIYVEPSDIYTRGVQVSFTPRNCIFDFVQHQLRCKMSTTVDWIEPDTSKHFYKQFYKVTSLTSNWHPSIYEGETQRFRALMLDVVKKNSTTGLAFSFPLGWRSFTCRHKTEDSYNRKHMECSSEVHYFHNRGNISYTCQLTAYLNGTDLRLDKFKIVSANCEVVKPTNHLWTVIVVRMKFDGPAIHLHAIGPSCWLVMVVMVANLFLPRRTASCRVLSTLMLCLVFSKLILYLNSNDVWFLHDDFRRAYLIRAVGCFCLSVMWLIWVAVTCFPSHWEWKKPTGYEVNESRFIDFITPYLFLPPTDSIKGDLRVYIGDRIWCVFQVMFLVLIIICSIYHK